MTIQEAISAVRNCEIVCRGNRKRTQELITLLAECETMMTSEKREVAPPAANHSEELSAVKEELYGITSENVKYRNAVDALMVLNGELKLYVVKILGALWEFKQAVSVSPSLFKDYDVDEQRVLKAFRAMPNLMNVSPKLRDFLSSGIKEFEKKGGSSGEKEDSETVHIA